MIVSWSWSHSPKLTTINPGAMFNIRLCLWSARCIEVIIWFIAVHRGEIGAQIERYCSFHLVLLQTPWAVVGCPTLFSICILSVMGYNVDYDDTVLYVVQKTNIFLICVLAHCLCVSVQKDHTWDSKKYNNKNAHFSQIMIIINTNCYFDRNVQDQIDTISLVHCWPRMTTIDHRWQPNDPESKTAPGLICL